MKAKRMTLQALVCLPLARCFVVGILAIVSANVVAGPDMGGDRAWIGTWAAAPQPGPFEGATVGPGYYSPEKEAVREEVNAWIRYSGEFDSILVLDIVLRDPEHPRRLLAVFDSGDHLHPNDAGYAASAVAVPRALFGAVRP